MRVAFHMPFKDPDDPRPSGDLVIGRGLADMLRERGHEVRFVSRFRTRWIFWQPLRLARLPAARREALAACAAFSPDVWLTYHAYWKAPDMLGPYCCTKLNLPYAVVQASYATKYRKRLVSWPGFMLNRAALLAADMVVANKRRDFENLSRLLPPERLVYTPVGLDAVAFVRDEATRARLRAGWDIPADAPVVLTAAMFRHGVKTEGILLTIKACRRLFEQGLDFRLLIVGDGPERSRIETALDRLPSGRARLLGLMPRDRMAEIYSSADVFAFPGLEEALGMVFLEAQACGLPVAAMNGWGVPEAVADGETGLLSPVGDVSTFAENIARLVTDEAFRSRMGEAGAARVRERFDRSVAAERIEAALVAAVAANKAAQGNERTAA